MMLNMASRYLADLEWRICHAVNIYIYRNGIENSSAILTHIPPAQKRNMKTALACINERAKFPIGYAAALYSMDGNRIRHPNQLQMYHSYVVANNFEKEFKGVSYGRCRSPLIVLNTCSHHVRVLRMFNEQCSLIAAQEKDAEDDEDGRIPPPAYMPNRIFTTCYYGPEPYGTCNLRPTPRVREAMAKRQPKYTSDKMPQHNNYPSQGMKPVQQPVVVPQLGGPPQSYIVNTCLIQQTPSPELVARLEPPPLKITASSVPLPAKRFTKSKLRQMPPPPPTQSNVPDVPKQTYSQPSNYALPHPPILPRIRSFPQAVPTKIKTMVSVATQFDRTDILAYENFPTDVNQNFERI